MGRRRVLVQNTPNTTMSFSEKFVATAKRILPSPFTIAVLLTFITAAMALILTESKNPATNHFIEVLGFWEQGFFAFLQFAMQMVLILILGHVLALTKPVNWLINGSLKYCNSTASAAFIVTLLTVLMALFNWGLGLIFGAVFARKVAEYCQRNKIPLNYPLIGAAGYSGLMVWHGGLSGSAPLAVANKADDIVGLQAAIPMSETVFSTMNIVASILLLLVLPLCMYWLGKRSTPEKINLPRPVKKNKNDVPHGAERLDHLPILAYITGGLMVFYGIYKAFFLPKELSLSFLNLNWIIFFLFGLGILFHGSFRYFKDAVNQAIGGAAGIIIQFPLYAGIMGIMSKSGLIALFSGFFIGISNSVTFPLFTLISAGVVNFFVPSGGGQWGVQGPIIIQAAQEIGVPLNKCIMALTYGDQLTNMMQPFWALPLLGITGLKAKDILPYSLFLMLVGFVIFAGILLVF